MTEREALARYAHDAWSGWMIYLFSKCEKLPDGRMIIPRWDVDRWQRQMTTKYEHLPEPEKDSDREEADRMLEALNAADNTDNEHRRTAMNHSVNLRPFSVPSYVIQEVPPRTRQEGIVEAPTYRLDELDAETLAAMCDEFRRAVFHKAGKQDPAAATPTETGAE